MLHLPWHICPRAPATVTGPNHCAVQGAAAEPEEQIGESQAKYGATSVAALDSVKSRGSDLGSCQNLTCMLHQSELKGRWVGMTP